MPLQRSKPNFLPLVQYQSFLEQAEDVSFGKAMHHLGVLPGDTRDAEGRERFLPLEVHALQHSYTRAFAPDFWLWSWSAYPPREGEVRDTLSLMA